MKIFFMFKRTKLYLIIGAAAIILIVIAILFFKKNDNLKTVKVEKGNIVEAVYGIGTVTANQSYVLKVAVATNVENIYVKEGDQVKKGAALIKFVDTPVFKAPFEGTINQVTYKIGETVTPQSVVLTMVNFSDRYVTVALEQQGAIRVERGQMAKMSFETLKDQTFEGIVEAIFSREGQFIVRVSAAHLPQKILPGMTVDVAVQVNKKENVLLIPISAFQKGFVFKQQGRSIKQIPIKTGVVDGEKVEIISGDVKENDILAINSK